MKRQSKPTSGPVEFIDKVIRRDEKGEAFRLAPYQRRVSKWRSDVMHLVSTVSAVM
jgi:hypothetical protein